MSVIPSALESGPAPANLQTSILNGDLRIASSGGQGQQNAVYTITGGPIISNVNLNLPALAADDTIATLSSNNNWTGIHTFAQGLNATGTINTTGPINSTSSITSGSVIANSITATGNLIGGNVTAIGNFNAANLVTPGTLNVGTTATITGTINALTTTTTGALNSGTTTTGGLTSGNHQVNGTHSVTGNVTLATAGNVTLSGPATALANHTINGVHTVLGNANLYGSGMVIQNGFGTEVSTMNMTLGTTYGMKIGTATGSPFNKVAFHGKTPVVPGNSHGAIVANASYDANAQAMINDCYGTLRTLGLLL
jgi:hypothetical protein